MLKTSQGKILIKTPVTTNGRDLKIVGGQIQYSEAIAPAAAAKGIEKINKTLPNALKHIVEPYTEDDGTVTAEQDKAPIQKPKK